MKLGVSKETAQDIIRGVIVGSASLVDGADFSLLRKSVTSKGGVTEAALGVMSSGMRSLLTESLRMATARMRELQK
jgi:pyrroline-5-carboxylate reductase